MLSAEQLFYETEKHPPEVFYEDAVLKHFCNIHGKTPAWNFEEHLFQRTSAYGCFWTDFMMWLFGNLFLNCI